MIRNIKIKTAKTRLINYFSGKLHLYTQFGGVNTNDNKEITQSFGLYIRYAQA
jgi:hypothetical protein